MYKLSKNIIGAGGNVTENIVIYPNWTAIDVYSSISIF